MRKRISSGEFADHSGGSVLGSVVYNQNLHGTMIFAKLRQLCAAQIPGDTYRALEVAADYSAQTFKHVLLPVWLLSYQYGGNTYRIVANGFTGAVAGKYPRSWVKIGFLVLFILIVLLIIVSSQN